jgi:hypothetical protein
VAVWGASTQIPVCRGLPAFQEGGGKEEKEKEKEEEKKKQD